MAGEKGFFSKIGSAIARGWTFAYKGVWQSQVNTPWIKTLKTLNLTVTSFFDRDLLTRAASLTFDTLLALVPALALMFAIGRGFGLQDLLKDQLFIYFPAQKEAIGTAIQFVDSYLNESTQGVFVGVGIIVLLYTLISLLSSIEESFNYIWGIKKERSFYQKLTDYIAICLLIPVLMICSSGISIFVSTVFQSNIHIPFLTPLVNWALDLFPLVLLWLAFSLSFLLIPNTKVNFKYAAIAGAVSAIGFQILELLFLNGQIYVTKYNAIYGSFAFLPLLLVWLQFSWVILLSGGTLCYSLQNVFAYNYLANSMQVSIDYRRKVALVVMCIIVQRMEKEEEPLTANEISKTYKLPLRLVTNIIDNLHSLGLVNYVMLSDDRTGISPAIDVSTLSAGRLLKKLDEYGDSEFIPGFNENYPEISDLMNKWNDDEWKGADGMLLKEITVAVPETTETTKRE